jgi:hypothetical protein
MTAYRYEFKYDQFDNIYYSIHIGAPSEIVDLNAAIMEKYDFFSKLESKVYVITDLTRITGSISYAKMSLFVSKTTRLRKKYVEMRVLVANSKVGQYFIKLYAFVSHQKIIMVKSVDEALDIIKAYQKEHGVFIPLS